MGDEIAAEMYMAYRATPWTDRMDSAWKSGGKSPATWFPGHSDRKA